MSPTSYVCARFPSVEIALGRCPNFSLLNSSFIVNVSGSSETKSRVVLLSIRVAVTVLSATFIFIFILSTRFEGVSITGSVLSLRVALLSAVQVV